MKINYNNVNVPVKESDSKNIRIDLVSDSPENHFSSFISITVYAR